MHNILLIRFPRWLLFPFVEKRPVSMMVVCTANYMYSELKSELLTPPL